MFPYKYNSDGTSKTNAFKQNFKEDVIETNDVPERLAESQSVGFVSSNEVANAATCRSAQFSSTFPTDQVPVTRDTIVCTTERGASFALTAAVTNCLSLYHQHAQMMTKSVRTSKTQQHSSYSKDGVDLPSLHVVAVIQPEPSCISLAAMTILAGESETGSGFKQITGCCTHHPNPSSKSEALCQVGLGETGGRAGADPTSCISPEAILSASVISSSSCGTAEPPSLATSLGAEQSFNAMFASHLGSSNSNSLSNCAQSRTISFTTTTTSTAMDVEPTHVTQAIENPNKTNRVQNQATLHHIIMQSSVNFSSIGSVREEACGFHSEPRNILLGKGQSEVIVDKKFTTGALSDQDNNLSNVKDFQKTGSGEIVEPQLPNQDANDISIDVRSVTPCINIPKMQDKGMRDYPFLASAINATVQGNIDSNPPLSFNNNNNNNKHNKYNINKSKTNINISSNLDEVKSSSKLLIHSATLLNKNYYASTSLSSTDYKSLVDVSDRLSSKTSLTHLSGPASNTRWGIPSGLGLRGGGESSLNSGTSSWGTPPTGNSNNSSSSGWGGANQSQGNTSAQNQWGNNTNNNNVNRNSGGAGVSGGTSQGPSGQQNQGNTSKGNNSQSGQPPPQQPPSSQAPPQQQQQQQQQQQNGSTSWAQAAGKGLPANQQNSGNNSNNTSSSTNNPGPPSNSSGGSSSAGSSSAGNSSTKQQLEQLNTMREALFSQDGWGGQHVNQDTGWDIPASPEPGPKDGVPVWKPNVNNGTDLWEANLRNGGQPPPSQTQKTPWGHTPTTNIGGTWGEDDDVGDSSNVWTGVPSNPGPGGSGVQWGGNPGGTSGAPKKDNDWSGSASSSNWGDPRDPRGDPRGGMDPRGDPRDPRNVGGLDPRDMRGSSGDPRELRGGGMMDPRDHMRGVVDPMRGDVGMRDPRDIRGMGDVRGGDPMMRGDPRGISGRLNGTPNDGGMWGQHPQPPHHHGPHHQQSQPPGKMVGPGGVNQWAGPPPKDMGMPGSKPSGWEEPSPPAQRRNIPNYDDGTSLWGNPAQQQSRMGGKVSHWKDMPNPNMGRGGMQCPPGMPQNRMPSNGSSNMKPDGTPLWGHPGGRNGSWGDGPHDVGNVEWGEDSKGGAGGVNSWNEPPLTPTSWGGPKPKNPLNPSGWVDGNMDTSSWGHPPKQGPKPLTKDIVWASKQFRILAEMGFKKEDVENALRTSNMNLEDAHEQLTTRLNVEAWRRHEDHSPFDMSSSHPGAGFPGQRFNPVAQQMPFAPPGPGGVNNAPSLLNNLNNTNPSLASINNISPAVVQKILTQQPPPQQPPSQQQAPFNQAPRTPQNQPSTAQLRMLVQQIQMAVQAGYLNHQILNQPLAPQTLLLLNQLLQQIKVLQQLMQQQAVVQVQSHKGNSNAVLHISVQITKTKQQITNLQNQIASQQAIYVKQQQQQHHMAPQGPQPGDFFKPNVHDPLSTLQSTFGELAINKEPQVQTSFQSQQSRLNQWKLPSLDKDGDGASNEFSRAPGTTAKPSLAQSHSSPNINPLLGQADGTWSTVTRSSSDTGWPDTSAGEGNGQPDSKDPWPVTTQASSAAFTDLVPEFEPGKPWKGTQMKSIEDDPSMTPGSVVRSPLSLATIKDTEIFNAGSKTSPTVSSAVDTPIPPLSLSSSTWSFNPPPPTSSLNKLGVSKGTWGEAPPPTAVTSELWGAPMGKSRGPPPGLSNKGSGGSSNNSNGWGSLGGVGGRSTSWGIQGSTWGSTWLLLRNLTPQIDGSTLKTLCVQHGPLQNFHLYLNHGIALAKYSTREEANKAQGALNNCVLGNTTIFAESPAESEVHALLQHLGHGAQQQPPGASAGGWNMRGGSTPSVAPTSKGAPPSDTWAPGGSHLWPPNPSASSLWGSAPLDSGGDQHRATPSSLNSFLPGDLLGGESM